MDQTIVCTADTQLNYFYYSFPYFIKPFWHKKYHKNINSNLGAHSNETLHEFLQYQRGYKAYNALREHKGKERKGIVSQIQKLKLC